MWIDGSKTDFENIEKDDNSFFEQTYELVRRIPEGRVTTYNAIAKYLNVSGNSSKMVGFALSNNDKDDSPVHRVVHRDGMIRGIYYLGSVERKQKLLRFEGIETLNDKIQNFNKLFWDPCKRIK